MKAGSRNSKITLASGSGISVTADRIDSLVSRFQYNYTALDILRTLSNKTDYYSAAFIRSRNPMTYNNTITSLQNEKLIKFNKDHDAIKLTTSGKSVAKILIGQNR